MKKQLCKIVAINKDGLSVFLGNEFSLEEAREFVDFCRMMPGNELYPVIKICPVHLSRRFE